MFLMVFASNLSIMTPSALRGIFQSNVMSEQLWTLSLLR